jgi:hypothetical protein
MTPNQRTEILNLLDFERQNVVYPGVTRHSETGMVKDIWIDGKNCDIAYTNHSENEIDAVIKREIEAARSAPYELEWKVYGHDQPLCLGERLSAAGFEAGDIEQFMVFRASEEALGQFGDMTAEIRRVTRSADLRDYQMICEEVSGKSRQKEIGRYGDMLENHPESMSVYVAYVDGEPATCGRIYFHKDSKFAGIYGGQTREQFRNRGLFTQIVAVRIREALSRGVTYVSIDALPTSEPILRKRGFEIITTTQPFCLKA